MVAISTGENPKIVKIMGNTKTNKTNTNVTENTKTENVSRETLVNDIVSGKITDTPVQSHKSRNDNYVIVYQLKNDKKPSKITNFTTCEQIKSWLRETHRGTIGMLHIFKSDGKTPCRLSAWIN